MGTIHSATPATAPPRFIELVRVSGRSQYDRDTPQDQKTALDRLRETRPGFLVERIEEPHAVSGALPLDLREDLKRLLQLLKVERVDEVRVRHLDRLARTPRMAERGLIYDAVAEAGAIFVEADGSVLDPRDSDADLMYGIKASMSNRERNLIRERTAAGKTRNAKLGRPQAGVPYARRWDPAAGAWGYDDTKLAVYRSLFEAVLAGRGLRTIAADLNARGVPMPGGRVGAWKQGTVARLIHHEGAIGKLRSYGHEMPCPPVVDEATFFRAAEILAKRNDAGRPAKRRDVLLRGLVVCTCGRRMFVTRGGGEKKYLYYTCPNGRGPRAPDDCRRYHRVSDVDDRLKNAIVQWLDGRNIYGRAVARHSSKQPAVDPDRDAAEAKATLKRLAAQQDRLLDAYSKGFDPEAIELKVSKLKKERAEAEATLARAMMAREHAAEEAKEAKDREKELRSMRQGIETADFAKWQRLVQIVVRDVLRTPLRLRPDSTFAIGADSK